MRDTAEDVFSERELERLGAGEDPDEVLSKGDGRPGLDLRELAVQRRGRTLRLEARTAAPTRSSILVFTGATRRDCPEEDALRIVVRSSAAGVVRVRASDLRGRRPTPLAGASATRDGTRVRVELLLPGGAQVDLWTVASSAEGQDAGRGYGDEAPDQFIESVGFTRGTGTPNDVGDFCDATAALAAPGAADERVPALSERDVARDLVEGQGAELRRATADRPALDLRAAGLAVADGVLRLRARTRAPLWAGSLRLEAATEADCVGAQLSVAIDAFPGGGTSVRAGELPSRGLRPVPGARATVDGDVISLELPLGRDDVALPEWTIYSGALGTNPSPERYADSVPDRWITGADFDPSGTPDYPTACGPVVPPLLPR